MFRVLYVNNAMLIFCVFFFVLGFFFGFFAQCIMKIFNKIYHYGWIISLWIWNWLLAWDCKYLTLCLPCILVIIALIYGFKISDVWLNANKGSQLMSKEFEQWVSYSKFLCSCTSFWCLIAKSSQFVSHYISADIYLIYILILSPYLNVPFSYPAHPMLNSICFFNWIWIKRPKYIWNLYSCFI